MRYRMLAAVSLLIAACAGSEPQPALTISPSGNQTATGPVTITASPADLANDITWSSTVPGTLSGDKGLTVVYHPPPSTQPVTVTASARGQTKTVTFTSQSQQLPPQAIGPTLSAEVNVTYDQYDIPHIFCANQNDCYAVQGYIQAQDRLFQLDFFRRAAEGRAAELVGHALLDQDKQFLALFATRDGERIETKLAAALDVDTKAKVDAFVSGVNAYLTVLRQTPTLMPQEYAQISAGLTPADIPDWSAPDTLAVARLLQFQESESITKETSYTFFALTFGQGPLADAGRVSAYLRPVQPIQAFPLAPTDPTSIPGRPPTALPAATVAGSAPGLAQLHAQMRELHESFRILSTNPGSNDWVVDASHSATGHAMVANDPHLSLQYPPLFHLAALTASDSSGLDVVGGALPGVPGVLIGRGKHVGWGVTTVLYDVNDLYEEIVDPTCTPTPCVKWGSGANVQNVPTILAHGQPGQQPGQPYSIKVRGENPVTFPVLVVPHHGPFIQYDPAADPTSAISLRWTGHEVTQDLKAILDLDNADSVGDLTSTGNTAFKALSNWAVAALNFVLADDQRNIGYDPHALVPNRPWAGTAPSGSPLLPWLLLPSDKSAEWGSGNAGDNCATTPAVPGPCWVSDDKLPHGVNPAKGYFATANSDPAGYTGHPNSPFGSSIDPTLYPYLSFDWSDPTAVRYARVAQLLSQKTANGGKVSLADMQAIQSDHALMLAALFDPLYPADTGPVVSALPAADQQAYGNAHGLLTQWKADGYDCPTGLTNANPNSAAVTDAKQLRDSAACLLFHAFLRKLLHNVFDDDFAVVTAAHGSPFSGDAGAEIRAMLFMLGTANTHSFCDDVMAVDSPPTSFAVVTAKTCEQQAVTALLTAAGALQNAYGSDTNKWLWGRVHTMTAQDVLEPLIGTPFQAGPFARPGGALTVDVGNPDDPGSSPLGFSYSHGSNLRFIAVMDPDPTNAQVKMQLPGPERDAPVVFSSSLNLLNLYVQNQYFDFLYGHQVDNKGLPTQRFTP